MTTAKLLVIAGTALLLLGGLTIYHPGFWSWFGRLPGDLRFERNGAMLFVPIGSMILLSALLTLAINLVGRR